jgi:cytochrome c-type biogenesis protein CcmH/NrfG
MARRTRGPATTNRPFTLLAIVIIIFLLASSLLILIPFGMGGDDDGDDDVLRVTPGAEVSRLETTIADNPGDVDSMVVLAEVLANSGRITESIPWFERAIDQRPDDAALRLAFGRALQRAGTDFDAELQLKRAVELGPDDPANAFYLAMFYETREPPKLDGAREWYQRAIDADPESVIAGQARDRMAALDPDASPEATP